MNKPHGIITEHIETPAGIFMSFRQFLGGVWGSSQSQAFKITSWVIAFVSFGGYTYYINHVKPVDIDDWNNKVKLKELKTSNKN
jgi:hypothetical protein